MTTSVTKSKPRVDKRTAMLRTEAVYRMILDGWTTEQIVQNVSRQWEITVRMARKYLARALQRIKEEAEKDQAALLAEHLAARRHLRREAKQANDLRLVSELLRDEARLLGLYPAERREIDIPPGRAFPVTIVEVVAPPDDNGDGDVR